MKRRVYNVVVDENGQPIARALVKIQLNTPTFVSSETKEVAAWGIEVLTDANGRWEVELEANDTMSDPNSYYRVVEHSRKGAVVNEYLIRVPSTGYADPIWIVNLLITPPEVTPPPDAVMSIAADNNAQLKGDVRLLMVQGLLCNKTTMQRRLPSSTLAEVVAVAAHITCSATLTPTRKQRLSRGGC